MSFMATAAAMGRLYMRTVVFSKRSIIAGILFAATLVFYFVALINVESTPEARLELYLGFLFIGPLGFLVQFGGLFYGLAVVSEELENGTIAYLFVRPLSRSAILLGRFAAAVAIVVGMLTLMNFLVAVIAMPPNWFSLFLRAEIPMLLGTAAYIAVFSLMASVFRNPIAPGLIFVVGWEMIVSALNFSMRSTTIKYHLLVMLNDLVPAEMHERGDLANLFDNYQQELGQSIVITIVVAVAAMAVSMVMFRMLQVGHGRGDS